jgi:hypothetical protein
MAVIQEEVELVGTKGRAKKLALFDSGATYSCIRADLATKIETLQPLVKPLSFETAKEKEAVQVTERVTLDFYLNGYRFSDEFFVISELSEEVIIGAATLQKWRFKLDFEKDEVIIDPRVTKLRLLALPRIDG